jgi:hypothetical protein
MSVRSVMLWVIVFLLLMCLGSTATLMAYGKAIWTIPIVIMFGSAITQLAVIRSLLPVGAVVNEIDTYLERAASTNSGRVLRTCKWVNVVASAIAIFTVMFV